MSIQINAKLANDLYNQGKGLHIVDINGGYHVLVEGQDLLVSYANTQYEQDSANQEAVINPQ